MKTLEEIKKEWEEKVIDILRAVHVHGVDGDFDGCDGLYKDPQSMSVQTATNKLSKVMKQAISQTKQRYINIGYKDALTDCSLITGCKECADHLEKLSNE